MIEVYFLKVEKARVPPQESKHSGLPTPLGNAVGDFLRQGVDDCDLQSVIKVHVMIIWLLL